jgi:hypothetical protein
VDRPRDNGANPHREVYIRYLRSSGDHGFPNAGALFGREGRGASLAALVPLALTFTPLLITALFTLTLLLLIRFSLAPLLLVPLFALALLLLVPLFALALLTLRVSLPTFRFRPVLPSLGFAFVFALPLALSLSPLVLAGGLFPLAALLISALNALLRSSLVLTLTVVLCLASTAFLPSSSAACTR